MTRRRLLAIATAGVTLSLAVSGLAPATADDDDDNGHHRLTTVVEGLDGPRGVDALGFGRVVVTETDGTFSLVTRREDGSARVVRLGQVPTNFSPAVAVRKRTVWLLTGAGGEPGQPGSDTSARLFKWRPGWDAPREVANIAAYQQNDPDPFDLEDLPTDSNPFGLAALHDGSLLVADAAGNDLLRVWPRKGQARIKTVARLKPRTVVIPEGLPDAGTRTPSEAVATSVTVGRDGYWYVGELRGYPATPGTSQIWRIKPGTTGAVCDPAHPWRGKCKRFTDGLTSIVDLAPGKNGVYALSLSKLSWLAIEAPEPIPGAEIGGLFFVRERNGDDHRIRELVPGKLVLPGGVDTTKKSIYVVGPVFGPGALMKIR